MLSFRFSVGETPSKLAMTRRVVKVAFEFVYVFTINRGEHLKSVGAVSVRVSVVGAGVT